MNLYDRYLLPTLVHRTCSSAMTTRQRAKVIPLARGDVLEVGFGSGLNLPFYDPERVTKVWGLDPSPELTRMASRAVKDTTLDVELVPARGEDIPMESARFDTAVLTYTLCTIPDPARSLREVARVLKPTGQLLFCEHGVAPDPGLRRWQSRLSPVWQRVSGGCHLDRDVPALLERAGFEIVDMQATYLPGWRLAGFHYWGAAVPNGARSIPRTGS